MKNDSKSNNQSNNGNDSSKSQKSDSKTTSSNGSNNNSNGNSKNSSNGNGNSNGNSKNGSNGNGNSKSDSKSDSKNDSKSSSKSNSKNKSSDSDDDSDQHGDENGLESEVSEENGSQMLYRQMDFSVSRMIDGEQTDIRIHRETGHPTDIYVSQGGESWTLTPRELDRLPKELEQEVRMLLNPEKRQPLDSWLGFFTQSESSRRDTAKLEHQHHESTSRH